MIYLSVTQYMAMEQGLSEYEAFNLIMDEEERKQEMTMMDAIVRGFSSHRELPEGQRVVSASEMAETQTFISDAEMMEMARHIMARLSSDVQYAQAVEMARIAIASVAEQTGINAVVVSSIVASVLINDICMPQGVPYTSLAQ